MKKIILALVALTGITSGILGQTLTPKGDLAKGQKSTTTRRRVIKTDKAPQGIGVYSQAIVAGELVFTSGQIGIDPKTSQMVEGGFEAQAEQVLRNPGTWWARLTMRNCLQPSVIASRRARSLLNGNPVLSLRRNGMSL